MQKFMQYSYFINIKKIEFKWRLILLPKYVYYFEHVFIYIILHTHVRSILLHENAHFSFK